MKRYRRKKGPVVSKKIIVDGIQFASGLEAYMYNALKMFKIKAEYEGKTFTLIDEFKFNNEAYERCANGKGEYKNRGEKKIQSIKYTPDFIGDGFIIECKGRANESFPIRWKMFKKHVENNMKDITLYKPQNHKECDVTIRLILEKRT
jgi:hypothetical protein|tara:strand:+ start:18 stop:461 length:444 start_codon:yes stop_codon:yes gene_type:complete